MLVAVFLTAFESNMVDKHHVNLIDASSHDDGGKYYTATANFIDFISNLQCFAVFIFVNNNNNQRFYLHARGALKKIVFLTELLNRGDGFNIAC